MLYIFDHNLKYKKIKNKEMKWQKYQSYNFESSFRSLNTCGERCSILLFLKSLGK